MTPVKDLHENFSERILLENSIERIGRLEDQVTDLLPSVGRVVESCNRIDQSLEEIKTGMSSVTQNFYLFQQSIHDINSRVVSLEETRGAARKEAAEKNFLQKRSIEDRRNKVIGIVGTALASFIVAVVVYFFGLR
jgi:archaellum component FlaC